MRFVVILDRQGASRANQDIYFMSHFVQIMQNNYPERLAMYAVIEPNWIFKLAFAAIKLFLSQSTIDKIKLLNSLDEMKQWFDEEQLITEHGGSSTYRFDPVAEFALEEPSPSSSEEKTQSPSQ